MKLADVLGALRRRWYVIVAGVLIAVGAFFALWTTIPSEYERTATQLLLPGEATIPEDANPYLFIGGLYQVADILVRAIGPDDVAAVTADFPGATVTVSRDTAAGAVMIVTVNAPSDEAAAAVLDDVLALTESRLEQLQNAQRIPVDERVDMVPLTGASESVVIDKNRVLVSVAATVAILALGAGAAVLSDTLLRSRRRRRSGFVPAAVADDQGDETDAAPRRSGVDTAVDPAEPTVDAASSPEAVDDAVRPWRIPRVGGWRASRPLPATPDASATRPVGRTAVIDAAPEEE